MMLAAELRTRAGLVKFRDIAAKHNACAEALAYMDQCIAEGRSLDNAIKVLEERLGAKIACAWFLWVRITFASEINANVKRIFTDRITRDNPRMAAHLDLTRQDLDASEDSMCRSRWNAEQLPMIADQVSKGAIKRPVR